MALAFRTCPSLLQIPHQAQLCLSFRDFSRALWWDVTCWQVGTNRCDGQGSKSPMVVASRPAKPPPPHMCIQHVWHTCCTCTVCTVQYTCFHATTLPCSPSENQNTAEGKDDALLLYMLPMSLQEYVVLFCLPWCGIPRCISNATAGSARRTVHGSAGIGELETACFRNEEESLHP